MCLIWLQIIQTTNNIWKLDDWWLYIWCEGHRIFQRNVKGMQRHFLLKLSQCIFMYASEINLFLKLVRNTSSQICKTRTYITLVFCTHFMHYIANLQMDIGGIECHFLHFSATRSSVPLGNGEPFVRLSWFLPHLISVHSWGIMAVLRVSSWRGRRPA